MKILSIRLHPFGATNDRTTDLSDGLNVVEGPNEFGKSTMTQALWHVLHTPSNLTPAKMGSTMGRYYPLPNGDHASVTLRFEADGATWTLEKTWGTGKLSASKLVAKDGAAIADESNVQKKLNELLRLNRATWEQVLFTRQAELAKIVESLQQGDAEMDDVSGLLAGAAAIPGDIPVDKMNAAVDDAVTEHFKRWDIDRSGPEKGKGIRDPWKNGYGPLLEAYYDAEKLRSARDEVRAFEEQFDAVTLKISALQAKTATDAEFVQQGLKLRPGLAQRGTLEERTNRLSSEEKQLMLIMAAWPGADQVIDAKDKEQARIGESLKELDVEIGHARQYAAAEALRAGHKRVTDAKSVVKEAEESLAKTAPVDAIALKELREQERNIQDLDIKIAAQKLAAKLESESARTVTLQRGTSAPESIKLTPGTAWDGELAGRFILQAEDLRITVQSDMEDVDALFTKREKATSRSTELLRSMGHANLKDAEAASTAHDEKARVLGSKQAMYGVALGEKSEEQWAADMAALAALPATRDLKVLDAERNKRVEQQAKLRTEVDQERKKVLAWAAEHTDVATLMQKVIDKKTALQTAQGELAALPTLPEGFSTVEAYLKELERKENTQTDLKEQLAAERTECARLEGGRPKDTAEDLQAELDLKQRVFEQQLTKGEALLRIQAKLEAVIQERGTGDPLQELKEMVSRHFAALTDGKYKEVALDRTAPVRVSGRVDLPTERLSQGTLGSLALATRLALAELYLKDDNGFLVLDDPFTDMDPVRRSAAAKAIGEFAQDRQVLLFTCHPAHAQELQELAGAQLVA